MSKKNDGKFQEVVPGMTKDERGDFYIAYKDGTRDLMPTYTHEESLDAKVQLRKSIEASNEARTFFEDFDD